MSPTDSIGEHWSKHLPIRFILETIRNDVGNSDTLFAACQSLTQLVRQSKLNNHVISVVIGWVITVVFI